MSVVSQRSGRAVPSCSSSKYANEPVQQSVQLLPLQPQQLSEPDQTALDSTGNNSRHGNGRERQQYRGTDSEGERQRQDDRFKYRGCNSGDAEDNWADNMTAVTSETGYSVHLGGLAPRGGGSTPLRYSSNDSTSQKNLLDHGVGSRCIRNVTFLLGGLLIIVAVISPIAMVILPRVGLNGWHVKECGPECEGVLISLAVKLVVLLVGTWALFVRRPASTLPRIDWYRAVVVLLVALLLVAYWLFYAVRIIAPKEEDYKGIVTFGASLCDALLFVHYLAVILVHIRQVQTQYVVKILRSPDGCARSYLVGQYSIQSLATYCLHQYYNDFPVYNPYLENRLSHRPSRTAHFKLYNIDGASDSDARGRTADDGGASSVTGSRVSGSGRVVGAGHNQRFYDELEHERKVKKRKARLIVAAEEAFSNLRRLQQEKGAVGSPMDAREAAQAIFPGLARPLKKYLHVTRQQPQHTLDSVIDDLAFAVTHDVSPKAFLSRYVTPESLPGVWNDSEYCEAQGWSISCDRLLNCSAGEGTVLRLEQGVVTLLVTLRKLPHISLSEDVWDTKNAKFVLRLGSDTVV